MMNFLKEFGMVNFVNEFYLTQLERELRRQDYLIYVIEGQNITDAQTFFLEIRKVLPQDPPLTGTVNWDAFLDSIWSGLDELGKNKVAFIWTQAENMLKHGLPDLILAAECFKNISIQVADSETGISSPVRLITFFVGKGDNFKPLVI